MFLIGDGLQNSTSGFPGFQSDFADVVRNDIAQMRIFLDVYVVNFIRIKKKQDVSATRT